jgi:glutamate synthase (NADPH/NADH) small chain
MSLPLNFALFCDEPPESNGKTVAVVGAGPAGLSAAGYLACRGYRVEVFDKMPEPGGLLVLGIPEFRLPIERIQKAGEILRDDYGVVFHNRVKVVAKEEKDAHDEGDDFIKETLTLSGLRDKFDAVLVCTGSWRSRKMNVPGEDLPGVYSGLDFLFPFRGSKCGLDGECIAADVEGMDVVIVGGGLSAVDAAQSALNSKAKSVTMLYRRTVNEAPAGAYEVRHLMEQGMKWEELCSPVSIKGEGKVEGIEYLTCELGEPDESGRRCPLPKEGSNKIIPADMVICAIGEIPTLPAAERLGMKEVRRGGTTWPRMTLEQGIFVAGDCLTGPSKIGWAITGGLEAARSMERWFNYGGAQ